MRTTTLLALFAALAACQPAATPGQPVDAPVADAPAADAPAADQAARVLTVTTSSEEARAAFEEAQVFADNYEMDKAIAGYKKALELDPGFATARMSVAWMTPGNDGLAMMQKAHEDAAQMPEAERMLIEARLAYRNGESNQGDDLMRKVVEQAPDDWRMQMAVAGIESSHGNLKGSLDACRRATELQPMSGGAWNRLAYAHSFLDDHDAAIKAVDKYVELEPTAANPHDTRGELLMLAGRLEEAEASFAKAAEMEESFYYALAGVAQTRFLRGDWEGGRAALAQARARTSRIEDALELDGHLAWSHFAEGDRAAADKVLADADVASREAGANVTYAWIAMQRAQMARLSGEYDKAMELATAGMARVDEVDLKGGPRVSMELGAEGIAVLSLAGLGKTDEAGARLAALTESAARSNKMDAKLRVGQGAVALSGGDAAKAIETLSPCPAMELECSLQLAAAHDAAGDAESAEAARNVVRTRHYRVPQYLGMWKAAGGTAPASVAK